MVRITAQLAILRAFGAHIFFDDQLVHVDPASEYVPSARVPYKEDAYRAIWEEYDEFNKQRIYLEERIKVLEYELFNKK